MADSYACVHGHEQPTPGRCVVCGEPVDRVRSALDLALGALDVLRAEVAKGGGNKPLAEALRRAEERAIVEALVSTDGARAEAARIVGMPLRTFMRKIPPHAPPAPKRSFTDDDVVDLVGKVGLPSAAEQLGLAPRYVENILRRAARGGAKRSARSETAYAPNSARGAKRGSR